MPSHVVLADVLVETGDDSSKDRTHIACNLESKEASSASLPERQDTPYEELTKVVFVIWKWDKNVFCLISDLGLSCVCLQLACVSLFRS